MCHGQGSRQIFCRSQTCRNLLNAVKYCSAAKKAEVYIYLPLIDLEMMLGRA